MKASVYVATSVDGFIAREDGSIDWLPAGDAGGNEDFGYLEFFNSVDALVMGRNTFEMVLSFETWPYGEKPVIVLSSHHVVVPAEIAKTVSVLSGKPQDVVSQLSQRGFQHVYIDGGATIQRFLAAGLIQQLIITKIPILIGSGISLFSDLPNDVRLELIQSRSFENGMVQDTYRVLDNLG